MKRFAPLLLVMGLAACGGSQETADANAEQSAMQSEGGEVAEKGPSDITAIDAATGFAGGMANETPESALPRIDARPTSTPGRAAREEGPELSAEPSLGNNITAAVPTLPAQTNNATPAGPTQ